MPERNSARNIKRMCLEEKTEKKKYMRERKLMEKEGYEQ
jgi:hypothetical protein